MKLKTILAIVAVLGMGLSFPASSSAAVINLTLHYDWERDGTFGQTSISLDTTAGTFTTGDGGSGSFSVFFQCYSFLFNTGQKPLYSGPFHGFMAPRITGTTVGWWYMTAPTGAEYVQPGSRRSDGSLGP